MIVPRMLRTIIERDLSTTVLGTPMTAPALTAPVGLLGHVHPDAECAVTRAAAALGIPSVLSTAASTSIGDVAAAAPEAHRWHQLYWLRDHELAEYFVRRAEAIVVTLDAWVLGWRPRDLQLGYLPFLRAGASPTTSPTRSSAPGCTTLPRSRRRPCGWPR
jgi:L-lactate dehydrogenase (cytochrome)